MSGAESEDRLDSILREEARLKEGLELLVRHEVDALDPDEAIEHLGENYTRAAIEEIQRRIRWHLDEDAKWKGSRALSLWASRVSNDREAGDEERFELSARYMDELGLGVQDIVGVLDNLDDHFTVAAANEIVRLIGWHTDEKARADAARGRPDA
jgi:hypothetical protein